MKDRVREAMFNLLGPAVVGSHAIDLFAGTGALGLEAVSRGAARATFIERHLPTAKLVEQNAAGLGVRDKTEVVFGDAFLWSRKYLPANDERLVVFCSPPFDFYANRQGEMLELIARWITAAPPGSHVAVEADDSFDFDLLPRAELWDTRVYAPAVVAIFST
jgi:16S rRNA (guanine966-N2)-methyltransferase